jgi:hypothetical protein
MEAEEGGREDDAREEGGEKEGGLRKRGRRGERERPNYDNMIKENNTRRCSFS